MDLYDILRACMHLRMAIKSWIKHNLDVDLILFKLNKSLGLEWYSLNCVDSPRE